MLHAYYEYSQLAALSSPSCPFCPLTPKSSQQGSGPRFLAPLTCRAPSLHLPCCMVADVVRYMITAPTWACTLAKIYAEQAPAWKMAPDSNNAGIEHDPTKGRATEANNKNNYKAPEGSYVRLCMHRADKTGHQRGGWLHSTGRMQGRPSILKRIATRKNSRRDFCAAPEAPPAGAREKKRAHGCHPAAKCSITLERLALPEQHKEAAEKIPLAQRWIEDGAGTDEAIFGRLQRVERPQRRRVGIGVGHVVGRGSESGSGAGCCRKASQVGQHECPDVWNGYSGEGPHLIQKAERVGLVVGRAVGRPPGRKRADGCKRMSQVVKHVRFDASKGYPGEGPDPAEKVERAMQKALDQAAIAAAEEDAGRALHDPYCVQRTAGNKRRRFVLEAEDSGDEGAERMQDIVGEQEREDCARMWQGTSMQEACPEGSMIGAINFFNVDNVAYGKGGMEEVVLEGQKVRTWIQAVVDHRSDEINVGGRVEQAFKTAYGRNDVRFVHSCPRKRSTQEEAGECSVIVMPELRARAQKVVKDRRGWGRYAGVVLEGRMQAGVQRKAAVITVYAPCGTTSAATQRQAAGIAAAAAAGQKGVRGKSPFAVLLKDLHAEIVELKAKGVADIIVGGDFNARHDGSVRPWRQLQAWRKRCGLGDALRELHPATEFVTYRAQGSSGRIATWIDHCFVSQRLIDSGIVTGAGVLDKRRHEGAEEAKVAGSMHNMLAVAVDFGRLLFIGHEVETGELVEQEYRMRYIGNKEAREKYAQQMQDRLDVLGVADMLVEAQQMRDLVRVARAAVGLVHNRQTDT